jgi:hypothetical protein
MLPSSFTLAFSHLCAGWSAHCLFLIFSEENFNIDAFNLLYLYIYIIPCEPPLGSVAEGVRALAMLGKGIGREGKKCKGVLEWGFRREYLYQCKYYCIAVYYGRLWWRERTNFCIYLFSSVSLILSLLSNLDT